MQMIGRLHPALAAAMLATIAILCCSLIYTGGVGASNTVIDTAVATPTPTATPSQVRIAWQTRASMPTARDYPGVAASGGKVYAIGGYDGGPLATVEMYDPATNLWATETDLPTRKVWTCRRHRKRWQDLRNRRFEHVRPRLFRR
jgi:hypothetical protein